MWCKHMFSETRRGEEGLHVLYWSIVLVHSTIRMTFFVSCLSVIALSNVLNRHHT